MKKKDLLLEDFKDLRIARSFAVKGGQTCETNDACTSGDEGCCDSDSYELPDDMICIE